MWSNEAIELPSEAAVVDNAMRKNWSREAEVLFDYYLSMIKSLWHHAK